MLDWYFASGDLTFYWEEHIRTFSWLPQVWFDNWKYGFNALLSLWLSYPFRLFVKTLSSFGLSWFFIEKILWSGVFILAITSSYKLAKYVFGSSRFLWMSSVVYSTNTYILLLFGGGQLGVALAFAFAPWALMRGMMLLDSVKKPTRREILITSLVLSLLIAFDLRLAYLTLLAIGMYACMYGRHMYRKLPAIGGIGIISGLLHAYWILPTVLASKGVSSLGEQFTGPGMLQFLSFADFSHAIGLLHPNWPENLFGKVYFMQPEFLLLPGIGFAALLLKKNTWYRKAIFFVLLVLMGAFFAKGVNDPFGGIFLWMFEHIPGFVMFRDPTKFYLLIAMGYAITIPAVLSWCTAFLQRKIASAAWLIPILFLAFWLVTIRAVLLGEVKGNFKPTRLPAEYIQWKDMLIADQVPSRTLWIPSADNHAFDSSIHPELVAEDLFKNASISSLMSQMETSAFKETLQTAGVKYVGVPIDIEHRLFLDDYAFDGKKRNELIAALEKTSLKRNTAFSQIAVFENPTFTMNVSVPPEVSGQQQWANKGALVSAVVLVLLLCLLFL